ncbi:MAG: hypothetical protein HFI38_03545 [Lachnospiraceae bacterium]|nr:hypothetical protein [Lachnospiraceae bacterium]
MFGYINVNKQELKFKEFDLYRSYYCGLCQVLKQKYGKAGQMTLTYDLTFLVFLLTDLYQEEPPVRFCRCAAHPVEKHPSRVSGFTGYAADMNILMSYYQCLDDWYDERKALKRAGSLLLLKAFRRACSTWQKKAAVIEKWMVRLHTYEKNRTGHIDEAAGCFGHIMSEIFACRQDEWEKELRRMGFYLGKFIYLMDAYEDLEKDQKSGNYNPLLPLWQEKNFEEQCHQILTMMLAEACRSFERLPLDSHVPVLRNILYSGVWCRYELISQKRKDNKNHV